MAKSHKDAAVEFLKLVASGKVREAYQKHVGPGFRHHNPFFRGDAASLMEAMEQNAAKNPNKVLEIQSAIQEGNRVAVFSRVRQNPARKSGLASMPALINAGRQRAKHGHLLYTAEACTALHLFAMPFLKYSKWPLRAFRPFETTDAKSQ
jgi:predicted SnoaL-like aldol condensation-catalyzing enzyme